MPIDIKTLLEQYEPAVHDSYEEYQKESERKAHEGLKDKTVYPHDEIEEYISSDTHNLSQYNSSGKHIKDGTVYNKPIEEFNSLIVQPNLSEHHKARILTNLVKHNALIDAKGGGEPHEYATDIQENALFKGYNHEHSILPKFDELHKDAETSIKDAKDLSDTHSYLSQSRWF